MKDWGYEEGLNGKDVGLDKNSFLWRVSTSVVSFLGGTLRYFF